MLDVGCSSRRLFSPPGITRIYPDNLLNPSGSHRSISRPEWAHAKSCNPENLVNPVFKFGRVNEGTADLAIFPCRDFFMSRIISKNSSLKIAAAFPTPESPGYTRITFPRPRYRIQTATPRLERTRSWPSPLRPSSDRHARAQLQRRAAHHCSALTPKAFRPTCHRVRQSSLSRCRTTRTLVVVERGGVT
jgi:hypothetical protein